MPFTLLPVDMNRLKKIMGDVTDTATHEAKLVGSAASHIVDDTAGMLGDALDPAQHNPVNDVKSLYYQLTGNHQGVLNVIKQQQDVSSRATRAANAAHDKIIGTDEQPRNTAERYVSSGIRGVADSLPFLLTGDPLPVLVSGAGAGVGGQAGHDIAPNSEIAPIVGSLVGGIIGGHGGSSYDHAVNGPRHMAAGLEHPEYADLADRIVPILEGGGSLDHPLVNPHSGAMGVMQVTKETAERPGYGIKPWDGHSQADLARVGREKLAVDLGMFDGDTDKALAAYNWGEGNVKAAIKKFGDNWLDHAPEETQKYVDKARGLRGARPDAGEEALASSGDDSLANLPEENEPGTPPEPQAEAPEANSPEETLPEGPEADLDAAPESPVEGPEGEQATEVADAPENAPEDASVAPETPSASDLGIDPNEPLTVDESVPQQEAPQPETEAGGTGGQEPPEPPQPEQPEQPQEEPGPSGSGEGPIDPAIEDKYAGSVNLNRLLISDAAKERIKNMASSMASDVETHEENKAKALELLNKKTPEQILGKQRVSFEELPHYQTAVRAIHAAAQDNVVNLAKTRATINPVDITEGNNAQFAHAIDVAAAAFKKDDLIGRISGRTLSARNIDIGGNRDLSNVIHTPLNGEDLDAIANKINNWPAQGGKIASDFQKWPHYVTSTYYDIDLLSRVSTQVVNVAGNFVVNAFEDMAHALASVIGTPYRMATGKGVSPIEVKSRFLGHVEGAKSAFRSGIDADGQKVDNPVVSAFKRSVPGDYQGRTEDFNMFQGKLGILGTAGKMLAAADEFFRQYSGMADLYSQSARMAYEEGKRGAEFDQRFHELIAKPTESLRKSAVEFGKMARLQDAPTPVGKWVQSATHHNYVPFRLAATFVMPFARMMDRSVMLSIRALPVASFADRITRADWASGAAGKATAVSRQLIGAGMTIAVAKMALGGKLTGFGPSDPSQRPQWLRAHQPESILFNGKWHSYARFPFAGLMSGVATGTERFKENKGKDWSSTVLGAALGFGHGLASESFAGPIADTAGSFQDSKAGQSTVAKFFGHLASDIITPGAIQNISQIVDPYVRDIHGDNSPVDILKNTALENVPGMEHALHLPKSYDVYGDPIKREGGIVNLFSPIKTKTQRHDAVTKEMDALAERTGTSVVTAAPKDGMNAQDHQKMQKLSGKLVRDKISELISDPDWQFLSDDEQRKRVKGALTASRKQAREMLFGDNNGE